MALVATMAKQPQIQVNRLDSKELEYELKFRGFELGTTVDANRKTLRSILKMEKSHNASMHKPSVYPYQFEEDILAIESNIAEIRKIIEEFVGDKTTTTYLKCHTKVMHTINRCDRSVPVSEEHKMKKTTLLVELCTLSSDLDEKTKQPLLTRTSTQMSLHAGPRATGSRIEDEDNVKLNDSDADSEETDFDTPHRTKLIPVLHWNKKFSGHTSKQSLCSFLADVEELRVARQMSYKHLLSSAYDLFTDDALMWYKANRRSLSTWSSLVSKLREEYQPADFVDKLLDEARQRTQGVKEPIGSYLTIMAVYFDRLKDLGERLTEESKLRLLRKNLNPFFQAQLCLVTIDTVDQLRKLGRQIEQTRIATEDYKPPSAISSKTLEPELTCVVVDEPIVSPEIDAVQHRPVQTDSKIKCFNCSKIGHLARLCPDRFHKKCYGCGKEGFTKRNCPNKCSEKELAR